MAKRELRIVKWSGSIPVLGVCEFCNRQFAVPSGADQTAAQAIIDISFTEHKCKPEDASQAARIVSEALENK